jgi:hypothetical protein
MKKFLFIGLILLSCTKKEYKYEIHKIIDVNDTTVNAIWYTDTIQMLGDTIFYVNSDSSSVKICPPYFLIDKTKK